MQYSLTCMHCVLGSKYRFLRRLVVPRTGPFGYRRVCSRTPFITGTYVQGVVTSYRVRKRKIQRNETTKVMTRYGFWQFSHVLYSDFVMMHNLHYLINLTTLKI